MPVPKRWFPASRDLNHDPEVWELTETFGDRALRIWLELLAGADKTENRIALPVTWHSSLARITKTNSKTVVTVVLWMLDRGWICLNGDRRAVDNWTSDLRALCQNWPKTPRKLVVQRLLDGCTTVDRWLNTGRMLTLGTVNYWKYRKRREPSGADNGSPPLLSESSLPNKKNKEMNDHMTSSLLESQMREETRSHLPPNRQIQAGIETITGPLNGRGRA